MPRFMLDTNICIYLMKNQPPIVAERFEQCYEGDVVWTGPRLRTDTTSDTRTQTRSTGQLIAAHAVALGTILVTNNVKDFAAYPGIEIQNWLDVPLK